MGVEETTTFGIDRRRHNDVGLDVCMETSLNNNHICGALGVNLYGFAVFLVCEDILLVRKCPRFDIFLGDWLVTHIGGDRCLT